MSTQRILHDNGVIEVLSNSNYEYQFFIKDHLGNTRVVCKPAFNSNGTLKDKPNELQRSDYYPFGMLHGGVDNNQPLGVNENRYLYNGKEYQARKWDNYGYTFYSSLHWYDYGARFYDAQLGRFHSVDRFAEKFSFQSPYLYAKNNPILFIDVNGDYGLPAGFAEKYPKTAAYLNVKYGNLGESGNISEMLNSDRVVSSMIRNSNGGILSKADLALHFMEGMGPDIAIAEGANYSFEASGTLYLGENMLNAFENATGEEEVAALTWLVSTILHEDLEQYTDDRLDDGTGCFTMEEEVFGLNLHNVEDGKTAIDLRTGKKTNYGEEPVNDPSVIPTPPTQKYKSTKEELREKYKPLELPFTRTNNQ